MIVCRFVNYVAKFIVSSIVCLTCSAYADEVPKTYGELVGIWKGVEIDSKNGKFLQAAIFGRSGDCTFTSIKLGTYVSGTCKLEASTIRSYDTVIDRGPPDPKAPSGKTIDFSIIAYDGTKLKLSDGMDVYQLSRVGAN